MTEPGRVQLLEVAAGRLLHLELIESPASVSVFACHLEDHDERLSMYTTQSVNHSWQLGIGAVLMSTDSRELCTLVGSEPGAPATYVGGGSCDPLLRATTGAGAAPTETCHDLFGAALVEHGLGARQLGPDAHFHPFAAPTYDPDGAWQVEPAGRSGATLTLRAEQPLFVAVLVCPHTPEPGAVSVQVIDAALDAAQETT